MCECTVLSYTEVSVVGVYKRGKRGREAPKSLLEARMIEASANIMESERVCSMSRVQMEIAYGDGKEPASSFYRLKEGRLHARGDH